MDSHLVAVKVGVVRCTSKRVKLKCSALNKYRLKCLNTESVKCRRTVEKNRVTLDYNFKCIPNLVLCTLNCFSCSLNIDNSLSFYKAFHNKRFEKLNSHFLRKTALVHLKFRAYNDNRTTRIVNTLTEKVLTETALLTFKHIGK